MGLIGPFQRQCQQLGCGHVNPPHQLGQAQTVAIDVFGELHDVTVTADFSALVPENAPATVIKQHGNGTQTGLIEIGND